MSDLAKKIARLSPEKRAELEARLLERRDSSPSASPIPRRGQTGPVPLSFAQQRLWFLQQLEPDNPVFNIANAFRLKGPLDVEKLRKSLEIIVERHGTLRTSFGVEGGETVQWIREPSSFPLPVTGLPEFSIDSERFQDLLWEETARPFDLGSDTLLRAHLYRMGEDDHVLLLVMHHISSDGWSWGILFRELERLYGSADTAAASSLPPLPVEYTDYALWQRETLAGGTLEDLLAYWRSTLEGASEVLDLPTDRPRRNRQTFRGDGETLSLPSTFSEELKAFAIREEMTPYMLLLAGFMNLLHRYTGSEDINVGSMVAGRTREELEPLIGFFVNTLVMRGDLSGDPTVREMLHRVRENVLGAQAHQDLPFEKLVDVLHPRRNLTHSPLFQVAFVLQNTAVDLPRLAGLRATKLPVRRMAVQFDITFSLIERPDGLEVTARYNTDLFDRETIRRLLAHYRTLLAGMMADPDSALSKLPLLSEEERQRVLVEWNRPEPLEAEERCVHWLFERQVEESPGAVALRIGDRTVTYRELNERANRIAHRLRGLGVTPEERVGICLERSFDMIASVIGVLKAGGAYVPLDPGYPDERLRIMLEDAACAVLLTREKFRSRFEGFTGVILPLDEEGRDLADQPAANPRSGVSPGNLAYVIYTSGSTGTPKGVMIEHRSLAHRIDAMREMFQLTPEDRQFQFVSFSFDVFGEEVYPPLCSGGSLVLVPDTRLLTPLELIDTCERYGVTKLNVPGSYWHRIIDELEAAGRSIPSSIRLFVTGAESPSYAKFLKWKNLAKHPIRLFNLYGPTEATIVATAHEISGDGEPMNRRRKIPIGRPLPGTSVYLLDRHGNPVPPGVVGEVYIGGVGVGRGYLDRPERTAEAFLPDPFAPEPGARVYRTGDLARYLPDGTIEFVGRADQQVKIRGLRIELGDIETALRRHEAIRDAVVTLVESETGDKRLVGYVVPEDGATPDQGALRGFLLERLPDYMIPAVILELKEFPLTPNGKVDRAALPEPGQEDLTPTGGMVPPRNRLEAFLAELFSETLGLESVGVEDDFFALGGDSIQAAILINRLQQRLDRYIYIVSLFDAPTVAGLAAYLKERYRDAVAQYLEPDEPAGAETGRGKGPVDEEVLSRVRGGLRQFIPAQETTLSTGRKLKRALFLLAPPRSGTTLMRVMLAGHPRLFAPPELYLLMFTTLGERAGTFSGRQSFWKEGLIRAVMALHDIDADEASARLRREEEANQPVLEYYRKLQEALGDRILVDKTPFYAFSPATLGRMEESFEDAFYLHLVRHPYGMIHSFVEAKIATVLPPVDGVRPEQLAESIWRISHGNSLAFLDGIPPSRQILVHFEDLVREPRRVMEAVCEGIGIPFEEEMLEPYREKRQRMTDPIHPLSRMIGDVKFHEHRGVEAQVADRWRDAYREDILSEATWDLAARFGYDNPWKMEGESAPESGSAAFEGIKSTEKGESAAEILERLDRMSDEEVSRLLSEEFGDEETPG